MATFVGTIGLRIKLKTGIDLSGVGTATIEVIKPSGATVSWTASVEAPEAGGVIYYDTLSGDLDLPGLWKVNAKWAPTGGDIFFGETACFDVHALGDSCN